MAKTLKSLFKETYQQKRGPTSTSFDDYQSSLEKAYNRLLDRNPSEPEVHRFFQENPCLVPGAWTPGSTSGHYPLHCALITQPRLPGFRSRQPDFMWISTHSGTWYPTLIEIESPRKKVFTKSGLPTSEFTEARNQLAQWRTWFNNPTNAQQFGEIYGIPPKFKHYKTMQLHMILIYGRREEFQLNPELSQHRASLLPGHDEELVSFDRIFVDKDLEHAITIRSMGSGRFRVVTVPPVFSTGPVLSERFIYINGFPEVLDNAKGISKARREFLKRRIPYWREWASNTGAKFIGERYWE